MLILLMILGVQLCCLQMARSHHLKPRHFRDVMRKKMEERVTRFTAGYTLEEDHQDPQDPSDRREEDAPEPYVWDCDYSQVNRPQLHRHPVLGYGNNQILTVIGGRYQTA